MIELKSSTLNESIGDIFPWIVDYSNKIRIIDIYKNVENSENWLSKVSNVLEAVKIARACHYGRHVGVFIGFRNSPINIRLEEKLGAWRILNKNFFLSPKSVHGFQIKSNKNSFSCCFAEIDDSKIEEVIQLSANSESLILVGNFSNANLEFEKIFIQNLGKLSDVDLFFKTSLDYCLHSQCVAIFPHSTFDDMKSRVSMIGRAEIIERILEQAQK